MSVVLYLDRHEAAKACSVSIQMLDSAVREGKLSAFKHAGKGGGRNTKVLFRPADLEAWVESWDEA